MDQNGNVTASSDYNWISRTAANVLPDAGFAQALTSVCTGTSNCMKLHDSSTVFNFSATPYWVSYPIRNLRAPQVSYSGNRTTQYFYDNSASITGTTLAKDLTQVQQLDSATGAGTFVTQSSMGYLANGNL